ncbi:MAG: virulence protein SciE type [Pseudomonadota bacterium]|nr:virulence protein SciE type [Pseudomonadota bacterium]
MANAAADSLLAAGDPKAALAALQTQVRERPADAKLRVFLFQLLCVEGQWQRALTQLQLCGELDAGTLAMVNTYREAIKCEAVREAVFAGTTTPLVLGEPQAWVATLVEALQADARGEPALAARLRDDAFAAAPPTAGSLDGTAFEWIADADSRLGPVLEAVVNGRYAWLPFASLRKLTIEAPEDLRDLVWCPAHLEFGNGGDSVALLPSRYPGTVVDPVGELHLSRRTEWLEIAPGQYRGLGQRVLATSAAEVGLLEAREVVLLPGS